MHWRKGFSLLLLSRPVSSFSLHFQHHFALRSALSHTMATTATSSPPQSSIYELEVDPSGKTIRKVKPYVQAFETFAKGRWLRRSLIEVLTKEFGGHPEVYWKNAIKTGHVRINGEIVPEDYKFQNSDKLLHRTHRHEPPVFGNIVFVGESESLFAVSKPPSMPMHPSGAYRFNSLEFILKNDPIRENQPTFHLVHRLDRVTSGLVVMAKSKATAASVSQEIRDKSTKKEYLARVKGRFPARLDKLKKLPSIDLSKFVEDVEELDGSKKRKFDDSNNKNVTSLSSKPVDIYSFEDLCQSDKVGYVEQKGENEEVEYWVDCPLGVVSHRDGVHGCDPTGKSSLSVFKVLGYCPETDTTLVHCRPYTGRTHQLRLHLQLCGNPIANDPCYGGELFFGDADRREKAIDAITQMKLSGCTPLSKVPHIDGILTEKTAIDPPVEVDVAEQAVDESDEAFLTRTCKYCKNDGIASQLEHLVHCDGIWLHAFRYSGAGWSFKAVIPDWASVFAVDL